VHEKIKYRCAICKSAKVKKAAGIDVANGDESSDGSFGAGVVQEATRRSTRTRKVKAVVVDSEEDEEVVMVGSEDEFMESGFQVENNEISTLSDDALLLLEVYRGVDLTM
jgi:hypothetical protein